MTGFIATSVIAGAFLLVAKLVIDYAGPHPKAAHGPVDLRDETERMKRYVVLASREVEKLGKHVSREVEKIERHASRI
jgi:hypothetical protein